jgi:DNA-binding transcriptional LysR family regulator
MDRADLSALQTFLAIAEQGSLRAAARVLGVNPPAVSHQLKVFEERLGTPLFLRSTRSVTLTDAGRALYEGSSHLLSAIEEALEVVREATKVRSGRLRITLPYRAWQVIIAPTIKAFQAAYPDIELDLTVDEALTDIIAHGFHAGIRLGDHLQDDMIAVRLSPSEEAAYVAAPDYLERHGVPTRPADLLGHVCIRHRQVSSGRISEWRFHGPGGEVSVAATGTLILNDLRTVVDAARRGLGIGWSLKRGVQEDLNRGVLVQVLADFTPSRPGFFLYFPKSLQQLALLRVFIEHFRSGERTLPAR